jgi:hypothetical protein
VREETRDLAAQLNLHESAPSDTHDVGRAGWFALGAQKNGRVLRLGQVIADEITLLKII